MRMCGYYVFSVMTKKRKRFLRTQKRTKADENVNCLLPPLGIKLHLLTCTKTVRRKATNNSSI